MLRRLKLSKGKSFELKLDGIFPITLGDSNLKKILILFMDKFNFSWRYTYENIRNGNVFSYNISGEQVAYSLFVQNKPMAVYVFKKFRNIGIGTKMRLMKKIP